MNGTPEGWESSALLRRHHAGLAGLIARFVRGPEDDGPEIPEETAANIVVEVYGRAGRATYGGLRRVDAAELKAQIKAIGRAGVSSAEAQALAECLGRLRIMQPLCANGHLAAQFTGPTEFVFLSTEHQCPVCNGRVLDPENREFVLIWGDDPRLGHLAEKTFVDVDGRNIPSTREGMMAAIVTLHPWWTKTVEGSEQPALEEIALVLRHGRANGVSAIPTGRKVLAALADPKSAGLDEWDCDSVMRAARGVWKVARNPFAVRSEPATPVRPAPGPATTNLTGNRSEQIVQILAAAFTGSGIPQLQQFAEQATGIAADNIMRWNLTQSAAIPALVRALEQANLLGTRFFDALEQASPSQRGDINRVRAQWVVEVEQVHFDAMALAQNRFEHVYMQELFMACFSQPMDLHTFWTRIFPHNQAHYNNNGRTIQDVAFGIGHMMGRATWSGERARYAPLWPALERLNPDKRDWINAVRKHYEAG